MANTAFYYKKEEGSIIVGQVVWFSPDNYAALSRALYVVTLVPTLFFLLNIRWHNRFFTWLGGYAYSIYLLSR